MTSGKLNLIEECTTSIKRDVIEINAKPIQKDKTNFSREAVVQILNEKLVESNLIKDIITDIVHDKLSAWEQTIQDVKAGELSKQTVMNIIDDKLSELNINAIPKAVKSGNPGGNDGDDSSSDNSSDKSPPPKKKADKSNDRHNNRDDKGDEIVQRKRIIQI